MNVEIKIDRDVPLPSRVWSGGPPTKWPWKSMEPGDSFFAAGYTTKSKTSARVFSSSHGRKMVPGSNWCIRHCVENGISGVRVWRIA